MLRRLALVMCALTVAGCGAGPTQPAALPIDSTSLAAPVPTTEVPVAKFSPRGKEILLDARRNGVRAVVLVISTEQGAAERTAAALRDIGATVEATDPAIGYVRASVPVDVADRAASLPGVSKVDVDEPIGYGDPTP